MENLAIFLVYTFFAVRFGLRFMDGRIAFLEQPGMKIIKIIVSVAVGYVVAMGYFLLWVLTTLEKLFRN